MSVRIPWAHRMDENRLEQRPNLRFEKIERRIDAMVTSLGALVAVVATLLFAACITGRRAVDGAPIRGCQRAAGALAVMSAT